MIRFSGWSNLHVNCGKCMAFKNVGIYVVFVYIKCNAGGCSAY